MRGLALEGGGAKGAYQAGAIKALNQRKIFFDGVAGTSIGAINAALYACGNFEGLYHLWPEMDSKYIFGIDGKILNDISNKKFKLDDIKEGIESVSKIIKNLGVDNTNVKKLLEKNINGGKLRKSKIDFGLITYNLSDRKPVEITKENIPQGKLIEYIIASSYLPIFKFERIIDDKYYIDGGIYQNCPIDMFLRDGYDEVYVIRNWINRKLKYDKSTKTKINIITPSEDLGSIMTFEKSVSEYRMKLGYYDTIKFLDKLDGKKYYFKPYDEDYYTHLFDSVTLKRMLKKYNTSLLIKNNKTFIINIIEKVCEELKINRFKVYNMPLLITKLKYYMVKHKKSEYYDFIKNIKVNFE